MHTPIIQHTVGWEFDTTPASAEVVDTASGASSDILSWNNTLDSTMEQCGWVLDTSNSAFLQHSA